MFFAYISIINYFLEKMFELKMFGPKLFIEKFFFFFFI